MGILRRFGETSLVQKLETIIMLLGMGGVSRKAPFFIH